MMHAGRKQLIKNYLLVSLGCLILALGNALFIVPNNLITGGITSIAVITQFFVTKAGIAFQVVDIVTWILQVVFLGVSFVFLGRQYTIRTLFASVLYPVLFTLLYRIHFVNNLSLGEFIFQAMNDGSNEPLAVSLLAAVFGGALVGMGVACSFAGGGTTGGLDIVAVIVAKVSRIKEGQMTFAIDGTLVLAGMLIMWDFVQGILGIVSAVVVAAVIQLAYVNGTGFIIADIITDKVDEVKQYVEGQMDRTTTIFEAIGGYSGNRKQVVRVAFSHRELSGFKEAISRIDPSAFVTFVSASMVHGEGFAPLVTPDAKALIEEANKTRKRKRK